MGSVSIRTEKRSRFGARYELGKRVEAVDSAIDSKGGDCVNFEALQEGSFFHCA